MSVTFTKLFSSITESTVWCEPDTTRITWIAMLAMADRMGRVWATIPGLANRARVSVAACETAINTFLSPDRYSRTEEHDGRRVEKIEGGWRLLNYSKYRDIRDEESIKESKRRYINERRAKEKAFNSEPVEKVDICRSLSIQAEAEAEAEYTHFNDRGLPDVLIPDSSRTPSSLTVSGISTRAASTDCDGAVPEKNERRSTKSKGTQLPDAFAPTAAHMELATQLGVQISEELPAFLDYHASKGTVFKDWNRGFCTWLRNARKFNGGKNGRRNESTADRRAAYLAELCSPRTSTGTIDGTAERLD